MRKASDMLYRDTQALIKLVLTEMEQLAAMPPEQACEPNALDDKRRRVVKRIWTFYRDATGDDL